MKVIVDTVKLSIIIVNYNVKYFLLQLLQSVYNSQIDFDFEVIIVDNASTDGSDKLIPKKFSQVRYIMNEGNVGFSVANNQAIKESQAQYVLLLNPDTILQEDTLQQTVRFMDQHPDAGAVGCRMIDGSGHFLPESKRGFPSPRVAFFKAFGLGSLFPGSSFFNAYYLGHLPEHEIGKVDVLTGAFMMLRKSVLDEIGLLDERFFMYGEDIDLSYRIKQAGHEVYYFPKTSIIHFKGESTNKDTFTYIRTFYGAMKDFARKHYSGQKASLLTFTLNLAIYVRAALSVSKTVFSRVGLPLIEFCGIWICLFVFSRIWAVAYFSDPAYYAESYLKTNISIYALIWIGSFYFLGAYDNRYASYRVFRGIIVGWLGVAVLYGLLGPQLRPSRTLVVAGGLLVTMVVLLIRSFWFRLEKGHWQIFSDESRRYLIVGEPDDVGRIQELVQLNHPSYAYLGYVSNNMDSQDSCIGHTSQLDQICRFYDVQEIIFSSQGLSSAEIMQWMTKLGQKYHYKMAPDHSMSIIGSRSKNLPGELYTFDMKFQIDDPYQRKNKRVFDVISSLIILLLSPVVIWTMTDKRAFMNNVFTVVGGRKSWVSYSSGNQNQTFPILKPGVLNPIEAVAATGDSEYKRESDYYYARDYTVWTDLAILVKNFSKIGS